MIYAAQTKIILFLSIGLLSNVSSFSYTAQTRFHLIKTTKICSQASDEVLSETASTVTNDYDVPPEVEQAKKDMLNLSIASDRGFSASSADRTKAKEIVEILAKNNPTIEPAAAYYIENQNGTDDSKATLSGKWTLIYTDAPDITSLSSSSPTAQLGKVGQECNPPMIKNVIEWKRPGWASSLPFSGNEDSRILQKVCCEGIANPDRPKEVDLKIVGLDLLGKDDALNESSAASSSVPFNGPASFLKQLGPIELRGFVKPPFGKFEILYLDENMRIIRTYQGFLAVNIREEEEWF